MGVELHISRTPEGAEERIPISAEEWLTYVSSDPELELWPEQGPYFVRWLGKSAHEDPWLDWFDGEISSKWPDAALYQKMLTIAEALGARVHDDDDTTYSLPNDWKFEPNEARTRLPTSRPWWKRILGGSA